MNSGLTERNLIVMELVKEGFTNSEIANMLGLSIKTIENTLRIIFRKLSVRNRIEAVIACLRLELLFLEVVDVDLLVQSYKREGSNE